MRPPAAAAAVALLGAASLAGCGGDDGSVEAFCATARGYAVDNPAAVFDTYDPADPSGAAELLRGAAAELGAWAEDAPGEVDDDVEAVAAAAEDLAAAFESPEPTPERRAELEASFGEVEAASVRLTSYVREQCAVELDPGATAVTPAPSTATTAAP